MKFCFGDIVVIDKIQNVAGWKERFGTYANFSKYLRG